jgi:uncharacterized membrane protein
MHLTVHAWSSGHEITGMFSLVVTVIVLGCVALPLVQVVFAGHTNAASRRVENASDALLLQSVQSWLNSHRVSCSFIILNAITLQSLQLLVVSALLVEVQQNVLQKVLAPENPNPFSVGDLWMNGGDSRSLYNLGVIVPSASNFAASQYMQSGFLMHSASTEPIHASSTTSKGLHMMDPCVPGCEMALEARLHKS